jgi:hypothetical protein
VKEGDIVRVGDAVRFINAAFKDRYDTEGMVVKVNGNIVHVQFADKVVERLLSAELRVIRVER